MMNYNLVIVWLASYLTLNNCLVDEFYNGTRPPSIPTGSYYEPPTGIRLHDFQGIPSVDLCINIHYVLHSCYHSCNTTIAESSRNCGCDAKCHEYNDCCPDYEIFCEWGWQPWHFNQSEYYDDMDILREMIPEMIGNRSLHMLQEDNTYKCYTPSLTPEFSYYMVASCPADATTDENNHCSNDTWGGDESLFPVYVNSDGLFYANKFCAACHGHLSDGESDIEFLSLSCQWSCDPSLSPQNQDAPIGLQTYQNSNCYSCKWAFDPQPRQCDPKVLTNCILEDGDQISKACHSYSANVYSDNETIYKNAHCAVCNGVNMNEAWVKCYDDDPSFGFGSSSIIGGVPLTVLFDFSSGTLQQGQAFGGPPPPLDCPEYFIYIRELHECRRVGCPTGALMQMGQCIYPVDPSAVEEDRILSVDMDPSYRRVVLDLAVRNANYTDAQVLDELHQIWWFYDNINYYAIEVYNRSQITDHDEIEWNGDAWMKSKGALPEEECLKNYTTGLKVTLEGHSGSGYDYFISHVQYWLEGRPSCTPILYVDNLIVRVSAANFPYVSQLCNSSFRVPKVYGERSFSRIYNWTHFHIQMQFSDKSNETFVSDTVPQEVIFTGGKVYVDEWYFRVGLWGMLERVYFCETMPLCSLVTLGKEDYRWQFDSDGNASLLLLRSNRIVPDKEIILTVDGLVKICLNTDDDFDDDILYSYSSGQSLATTIGCVVSLTLLALVIITYCSFASLRNIPGKTILSLSLSLFFAQLLLLMGASQTANSIVCIIIACFMHYFWVSVFTWTNILAFDLGRTFGKKSSMRGDDTGGSTFKKYSLYGWGAPLIVVGITVIVHFFQKVEGTTGNIYDLSASCWLRTGIPLLISFGVPVAIALMANIVFFTRTVQGIRSTMQMAKILKKDHEDNNDMEFLKKELYLYVRLSVTVGLTWITGFIIPYTGVEELGYLFIILNSLQGPVIFISFTCSRRVMKLWSGKFGSSLYSTTTKPTSTGSSSVSGTTTQTTRGIMRHSNKV